MADRFLIAPYDTESGQQNNYRPWLIPDTAFSQLNNAYVFRGRVRKRFGSKWMGATQLQSRLRIDIGVTPGPLVIPNSAVSNMLAIGQMFSVGSDVFTITQLGNVVTLSTNPAITSTINTTVNPNTVTFAGAPAGTTVFWYPSLPVMGLLTREVSAKNNELVIGFDTRFAYEYITGTGWSRLAAGASVWAGDNSQFFWGTNWTGANPSDLVFFVTNFDEDDPNYMRYFFGGTWTSFRPQITAADFLNNARILVPFKNRLVAFNTWEGPNIAGQVNYPFRARYSQAGSPLDPNAFRSDTPGLGNAIDAATSEAIVTVEFIKDRLIVFFERSTWEFVYTGNQAYPFTWQQINTELGAESTFSIVPFDKVAVGVGNVGIMAASSGNVERIDQRIPNEVFQIHNDNSGVERVYGIRDYFTEQVYWSFPAINASVDFPYPNRVLVYNYDKGTWAFNDDSFTCFGYFQSSVASVLWSSTLVDWSEPEPWGGASQQAQFRQIIAGNQEGYVVVVDSTETTNASAIQITNLTVAAGNVITITAIDHNFREGEFVYLEGISGTGNLNLLNNVIFKIRPGVLKDSFSIVYTPASTVIAGTYRGAGIIARVSKITIRTKEYNFYAKQARNAFIPKVDFLVDKTDAGQIQVDFYVSTNQNSMVAGGQASGSLLGSSILETSPFTNLYPYEANATRLWHPLYFNAEGEVIQFLIELNDTQMLSTNVRRSDFQLHALAITASPTSRLQ